MSEEILNRGIEKIKTLKERPCYLVGGYMRNRLLGIENTDADIVSNEKNLAQRFADSTGYSFFSLKGGFFKRVAREGLSWDFTPLGTDIKTNLSGRDFRCDALAVDMEKFAPRDIGENLIDPFGGREDIKKKIVSPVGESIFTDDPVRIMRAFALYAQFEFSISAPLNNLIQRDRQLLTKAKGERIWQELKKIAGGRIETAVKISVCGVSAAINPGARGKREIKEIMARAEEFKNEKFKSDPVFIAAILWEEEGVAARLKFSSKETKILKDYISRKADMFSCWKRKGTGAERIFRARWAIRGESKYLKELEIHGKKLKKLNPRPLLEGKEIMEMLDMPSSPAVGDIKDKLLRAQFYGRVKSKKQASEFIKRI